MISSYSGRCSLGQPGVDFTEQPTAGAAAEAKALWELAFFFHPPDSRVAHPGDLPRLGLTNDSVLAVGDGRARGDEGMSSPGRSVAVSGRGLTFLPWFHCFHLLAGVLVAVFDVGGKLNLRMK